MSGNKNSHNLNILIVGAGSIAQEYAKILKELNIKFSMVCRSLEKAKKIKEEFNFEAFSGGIESYLKETKETFDCAINAVDTEALYPVNKVLINSSKVKKILSEKPGAFTLAEFQDLKNSCIEKNVKLFIAYNRRSFASVLKLKEILKEEKNTSIFFEFTEWFWRIDPSEYSENTLKEWLLCNSSHVIDLVFFLGDGISEISATSKKNNPYMATNTQYVGHGTMKNGALFAYIADWESAGRWKVEVSTKEGRYMLCPLEKIFFQKRGTLEYIEVSIDRSIDEKFKPGFCKQVVALVENNEANLKTIDDQMADFSIYQKMKGV